MKILLLILLMIQSISFAAETNYWSFTSNSNNKQVSECVKIKDSELQKSIKEMGCLKVFSSGILFCSEKRVMFYFPDEKQCLDHKNKVKLN